ncbi:hypothetical protein CGRA01v4_09995 [Colletotrichum graminicola]|nr:hypothetical protein CGRA01v4_09995 [Colletotrichum graminicola]
MRSEQAKGISGVETQTSAPSPREPSRSVNYQASFHGTGYGTDGTKKWRREAEGPEAGIARSSPTVIAGPPGSSGVFGNYASVSSKPYLAGFVNFSSPAHAHSAKSSRSARTCIRTGENSGNKA